MPTVHLRITEASNSIMEAVAQQVSNEVLANLGFSGYFKDSFYLRSDYMESSISSDSNNDINLTRDRCDVRFDPSYNPMDTKWEGTTFKHTQAYGVSARDRDAFTAIFHDKDAAVRMVEQQVPCMIALNFTVKFKNREDATLMMTSINNNSINASVVKPHDLAFNYPLDMKMAIALYSVWKLRNSINTQIDFLPYLQKYSKSAISYLITKDVSLKKYVIKKANLRAMGVLECSQRAPDVVVNNGYPDLFTIEFTYTIQFSRPDSIRLYMPVTVENQVVPREIVKYDNTTFVPQLIGLFQEMSLYSILREFDTMKDPYVQLPVYDDWAVPTGYQDKNKYNVFFTTAFTLDPGTTTIDLTQLGEYNLHQTVLDIIAKQGQGVFGTQGIFRISIFANDTQIDPQYLSINNLVISANLTNTLRRYHLIVSEIIDLNYLDPTWIPTILEYRTFFPITIVRNLQYLIDQGFCYVDSSNAVIGLVQRCIASGYIDVQIAALIAAGHVTEQMYAYATTAEQLTDYMLHQFSPVSENRLYDEYVTLCLQMNLISESNLPSGQIITSKGYAYLSNNAIANNSGPLFNTPLRVENVSVVVQNS